MRSIGARIALADLYSAFHKLHDFATMQKAMFARIRGIGARIAMMDLYISFHKLRDYAIATGETWQKKRAFLKRLRLSGLISCLSHWRELTAEMMEEKARIRQGAIVLMKRKMIAYLKFWYQEAMDNSRTGDRKRQLMRRIMMSGLHNALVLMRTMAAEHRERVGSMRRALLYVMRRSLALTMVHWIQTSAEGNERFQKMRFAVRCWAGKTLAMAVAEWRSLVRQMGLKHAEQSHRRAALFWTLNSISATLATLAINAQLGRRARRGVALWVMRTLATTLEALQENRMLSRRQQAKHLTRAVRLARSKMQRAWNTWRMRMQRSRARAQIDAANRKEQAAAMEHDFRSAQLAFRKVWGYAWERGNRTLNRRRALIGFVQGTLKKKFRRWRRNNDFQGRQGALKEKAFVNAMVQKAKERYGISG